MYISEISPAHRRGRLVAMFQFNIVTGILIAFISNYLLFGVGGEESWRYMLGVQAIPSLLFVIMVIFVPESPRWLFKQNRVTEGTRVLAAIGEPDPELAAKRIEESLQTEAGLARESLWNGLYNQPVLYVVVLAIFNQVSGINAIMYYAPRIFEMTGMAKDAALLRAVSIGVTNMVFTLLAISIIDKFGRKPLLIIGSVGMVLFLGLVGWAFYTEDYVLPGWIHCILRLFPRCSDLGVYGGDLSEQSTGGRSNAGEYNALGDGCCDLMDISGIG
jgi:MFS family permease